MRKFSVSERSRTWLTMFQVRILPDHLSLSHSTFAEWQMQYCRRSKMYLTRSEIQLWSLSLKSSKVKKQTYAAISGHMKLSWMTWAHYLRNISLLTAAQGLLKSHLLQDLLKFSLLFFKEHLLMEMDQWQSRYHSRLKSCSKFRTIR